MHGNIPYLFDFWANPYIHLFLLKSSMPNAKCPMHCRFEQTLLALELEIIQQHHFACFFSMFCKMSKKIFC